jgi:hypothetical protein
VFGWGYFKNGGKRVGCFHEQWRGFSRSLAGSPGLPFALNWHFLLL